MKAIKLILVFALILGGVIGAFLLVRKSKTNSLSNIPDTTFQTYRDQIINDWENEGDWNEQLFLSNCNLIQLLSKSYDVSTLRDLNTKMAIEIVYEKIFAEWATRSCRKNVIYKYSEAINVIVSNDGNAKTDANVAKIKRVRGVYDSAYQLANQEIGLKPRFDDNDWNSYADYSYQITEKTNKILENSDYKSYLSNIDNIKNGLNAIPDKLSKGKNRFYNELADQIISSYSIIAPSERTESQLKDLRNLISRFTNEYCSNQKLSKFAEAFANDVNKNVEAKETNVAAPTFTLG